MLQTVPISRPSAAWAPSRFQAPPLTPRLSQTVVTTPTTPPGAVVYGLTPPKPAFIDSALVSALMSGLGATAYGILSYAYSKSNRPTWSTIFFGVSLLFGAKTIYDMANIRER